MSAVVSRVTEKVIMATSRQAARESDAEERGDNEDQRQGLAEMLTFNSFTVQTKQKPVSCLFMNFE